jgi:hypothetical protein
MSSQQWFGRFLSRDFPTFLRISQAETLNSTDSSGGDAPDPRPIAIVRL